MIRTKRSTCWTLKCVSFSADTSTLACIQEKSYRTLKTNIILRIIISSGTITQAGKLISTGHWIIWTSSTSLIPIKVVIDTFTLVITPSLIIIASIFTDVSFIIIDFINWGTKTGFSICCYGWSFRALSAFIVQVVETCIADAFILGVTPDLIGSAFLLGDLDTVFSNSVKSF